VGAQIHAATGKSDGGFPPASMCSPVVLFPFEQRTAITSTFRKASDTLMSNSNKVELSKHIPNQGNDYLLF
jgi:hypothetical protein